ncbi:MAG: hypothetical protein ACJA1L_002984 [Paracoccaceae bacterium]|jgi:hypothetical protein
MSERLVVHAHVPGSGAGGLDRQLFRRSFGRREAMLAYGAAHFCAARLRPNDAAASRLEDRAVRLALGHVPYGYFDGLRRWRRDISVFVDPVRRYLRFASALARLPGGVAAALTGSASIAAAGRDPEALICALLATPQMQAWQSDAMTRIAAGLPAFGPAPPACPIWTRRAPMSGALTIW